MKVQEVLLLIRPSRLRSANAVTALNLYSLSLSLSVKCVLVDMPKGFEALLSYYDEPSKILESAMRLSLLPPSQSMARAYEPIVQCLMKLLREDVKITCYVNLEAVKDDYNLALRISTLTLRASIKKPSDEDLQHWLQLLEEKYYLQSKTSLEMMVNNILNCLSKIEDEVVIVLSGLEGFDIAKLLRKNNIKVTVKAYGLPYLRPPIEVMHIKYARGKLSMSELKKLIEEHVDYVRSYVLRYENLDKAHEAWSMSKAPWLKDFLSKALNTYPKFD